MLFLFAFLLSCFMFFFFFKQKTAYEMRISDWSSDVCSSDLAAQAIPLGLARADELVDHHLRAVGEVAELAFPDVERVRVGGGVAVFERHHRFLAEQRVDDRGVARL